MTARPFDTQSNTPNNRSRRRKPAQIGATNGNPSTSSTAYIPIADKAESIMKRLGTALLVVAMIAALMAIPLGVAAATDDGDDSEQATPGEQLGGVVGVQAAAVDGELEDRTFGQQIANADSDEERADRINERLNRTEQRIADHEERVANLQERRDAGEISEGRYQAQLARLEAEQANTERSVEQANQTARGLPEDVLAERGVSTDRINELRNNARQMGGPATSEAARGIAGGNVTGPIAGDRGDRPAADRSAADRPGADRSDANQSTADRERGDHPDRDGGDDTRQNESTDNDTSGDGSTDDGSTESAADDGGEDTGGSQHSDRGNSDQQPN